MLANTGKKPRENVQFLMAVIWRPLSIFLIGFWQLTNELATTIVVAGRAAIASHR
jgi:hypothetical protein